MVVGCLLVVAFTFDTCKKDDDPTEALITVVDSLQRAVSNATVVISDTIHISAQTGQLANKKQTGTTDSGGKVTFEFDYEAYLNVDVYKGDDTAHEFIQLKEHDLTEKTVQLN